MTLFLIYNVLVKAVLESNPYHDPYFKPHPVDAKFLKRRCVDVLRTLLSGMNDYNYTERDDADVPIYHVAPNLLAENRKHVEEDLVRGLLEIGMYVRTVDDVLGRLLGNEDYLGALEKVDLRGDIGVDYEKGCKLSLRSCCNKLIHALDVRPVYSQSDESGAWFLRGSIELLGAQNKQEWNVSIEMLNFLEGVYEVCEALQKIQQTSDS